MNQKRALSIGLLLGLLGCGGHELADFKHKRLQVELTGDVTAGTLGLHVQLDLPFNDAGCYSGELRASANGMVIERPPTHACNGGDWTISSGLFPEPPASVHIQIFDSTQTLAVDVANPFVPRSAQLIVPADGQVHPEGAVTVRWVPDEEFWLAQILFCRDQCYERSGETVAGPDISTTMPDVMTSGPMEVRAFVRPKLRLSGCIGLEQGCTDAPDPQFGAVLRATLNATLVR